jgi:hypothetical protein
MMAAPCWFPFPGNPVLTVLPCILSCLFCPGCCFDRPVRAVTSCYPALVLSAVLSWRSFPGIPVLSLMLWQRQFYPCSPFLACPGSSILTVLFWLSLPGYFIPFFWRFCSCNSLHCAVQAVIFRVLYSFVLAPVLLWLFSPTCLFMGFLFWLSPVAVLFWLWVPRSAGPVGPVLAVMDLPRNSAQV